MNTIIRNKIPKLPLDGNIDLTFRCNNHCRHCWLWLPSDSPERQEELSFVEIRRIVDDARNMGCQAWAISGGEPMLRADFPDIFDYITRKSVLYRLNTNGTLITPAIARMMTRKGNKMVALYGATAEVHDYVTRNPGSFEATMRGISYLKEAKAGFTIQVIPMAANYHQYAEMLALAESLSPHYRIGAQWLYLSAARSEITNREIVSQRLDPSIAVSLNPPDPISETFKERKAPPSPVRVNSDSRLFASCLSERRDFHIDPYGGMSFCCFIKDPALRFDLRRISFHQIWDELTPSIAEQVHGGQEYLDNCGSCKLREHCRWCPVYGYLEHGRFSAKVEYLCQIAEENRRYKDDWKLTHVRYYGIAGITIQVAADFTFKDNTFASKIEKFRIEGPGDDMISLRLISPVPTLADLQLGKEVYHQSPWAVYRQRDSWAYVGISEDNAIKDPHALAIFSLDHGQGTIYRSAKVFERGNLEALTTFVSDQILIARLLADRQGIYLHASGIVMDGKGLLFVGHSEAGKSTMMKLLRQYGEILCDDRIIIRRWPEGFRIHGTWSHGELPNISTGSAPLRAIFFLEKSNINELIPVTNKLELLGKVLSHVVKPFITTDWWEKVMDLAKTVTTEVPIYRLKFDKSGGVVDLLKQL